MHVIQDGVYLDRRYHYMYVHLCETAEVALLQLFGPDPPDQHDPPVLAHDAVLQREILVAGALECTPPPEVFWRYSYSRDE